MEISVVIPAYRSAQFVDRTIRSALDEGVDPHIVIVVEDGIVDDTADVVASFRGSALCPSTGTAALRVHATSG